MYDGYFKKYKRIFIFLNNFTDHIGLSSKVKIRWRQYGEYLFHLSYLYVKDSQIAEEITQDVFMKYTTNSEMFRGEAALKTYLTWILINRCHDELRKMKRKSVLQFLTLFWINEKSAEQQEHQNLKQTVLGLPIHYIENTKKYVNIILQ